MAEAEQREFADLVDGLRSGSSQAAERIVELYGPHILRVVRRALSLKIRDKFDSQDFVQAVWASFFTDQRLFDDVEDEEQLVRLLARMARNKIIDEHRRRTTLKYDVDRERSIDDSCTVLASHVTARDPTPSQLAVAQERWRHLMADSTKVSRMIMQFRLDGLTHSEIASELGISTKTVQRTLKKLEDSSN